jgi:hypothetical protein
MRNSAHITSPSLAPVRKHMRRLNFTMAHEVLSCTLANRASVALGGNQVTNNVKGLLKALRQSINEAILESNNVAAAMAALKRTGKYPVFSIDIALEGAPQPAAAPGEDLNPECEVVLSDADVQFLAAVGIADPSWSFHTPIPVGHSTE